MKTILSILILLNFAVDGLSQTSEALTVKKKFDSFVSTQFDAEQLNINIAQGTSVKSGRSTKLAILFSALLPGAGQTYMGKYVKGAAFFGAEAAMFLGLRHYNSEGDRLKSEFRAWLDQPINGYDTPWNESDYFAWKEQQPEGTSFGHSLPWYRTQQYYEMISKYHQFVHGWADVAIGADGRYHSELAIEFMAMQHAQNKKYKKGEFLANMMLVNRLLSVADLVIAKKFSSSKFRAGIRLNTSVNPSSPIPVLTLNFRK